MKKRNRIIFFGTPLLANYFLKVLLDSQFTILAVLTQPDRPVGRKNVITSPPVKTLAIKNSIPVLQPKSLKDKSVTPIIKSFDADLFIVVAYGLLIPESIIDMPKYGIINVHPSLLPKYRGASPIQSAILNNDKKTGITIMKLDSGMDTGPIIDQTKIKLDQNETTPTLTEKIIKIGPKFLIKTLDAYLNGILLPKPQNNSKSSTTKQLTKNDGLIDWTLPTHKIESQIRAYQPWPGSYTFFNNTKIEILSAKVFRFNNDITPGTVLSKANSVYVSTGQDLLKLIRIKPASKNQMTAEDFTRGHKDFIGSVLH